MYRFNDVLVVILSGLIGGLEWPLRSSCHHSSLNDCPSLIYRSFTTSSSLKWLFFELNHLNNKKNNYKETLTCPDAAGKKVQSNSSLRWWADAFFNWGQTELHPSRMSLQCCCLHWKTFFVPHLQLGLNEEPAADGGWKEQRNEKERERGKKSLTMIWDPRQRCSSSFSLSLSLSLQSDHDDEDENE